MQSTSNSTKNNFDNQGLIHTTQAIGTSESKNRKSKDKSSSASYDNSNTDTSPANKDNPSQYTSNAQHGDCKDDPTPGPTTYSPLVKCLYRSAPAYTIGGRNHYRPCEDTPGPCAYQTKGNFCDKPQAPHHSLGQKHSWKKAPFLVEYKD